MRQIGRRQYKLTQIKKKHNQAKDVWKLKNPTIVGNPTIAGKAKTGKFKASKN